MKQQTVYENQKFSRFAQNLKHMNNVLTQNIMQCILVDIKIITANCCDYVTTEFVDICFRLWYLL